MPDNLASLKIEIQSGDVKKATDELNKLGGVAGKTEGETKKLSSSFTSLGTILTAGAIITATKQFVQMADTMTSVQNKLRLVTKSSEELATVQNELFKIAQKTRQGFAETADTYSNFAIAMGNMGKSQKEVLRTVETINKAIAISGGTTQQAAAATMQLGQAFASGTLRGDELNSILENSKGLAQAIADGMQVPIGDLRKLGSEGKITAEILANALEKSANTVDEKFGKTSATVGQAMTQMENSVISAIGEFDKMNGVSASVAKSIQDLSKYIDGNGQSIDTMVRYMKDAIFFGGLLYGSALAVDRIIAVKKAMEGLTLAQYAFNTATKANPYVLLALAGVSLATYLYDQMSQSQDVFDKATKKAEDAHLKAESYSRTAEGRAQVLGNSYKALEKSLEAMQKARLGATGKQAEGLDKSIKSIQSQMTKVQNEAKNVEAKYGDKPTSKIVNPPKIPKSPKSADKGKSLEELAKEEHDLNVKAMDDIQKKTDRATKWEEFQLAQQERLNKSAEEQAKLLKDTEDEMYLQTQKLLLSDADYKKILLEREYTERFAIVGKTVELEAWKVAETTKINKEGTDANIAHYKSMAEEIAGINIGETMSFSATGDKEIDQFASMLEGMGKVNDMYIKQGEIQQKIADERAKINADDKTSLEQKAELNAKLDKKELDSNRNLLQNEVKSAARTIGLTKNVFKEKSTAYKILGNIEKALNIASLAMEAAKQISIITTATTSVAASGAMAAGNTTVALTSAAGAVAKQGEGDPVSAWVRIPAMIALMGTVLAMGGIAFGGGSGGSGGGASFTAPTEDFAANKTTIEDTYTPMTDRLDRQIELLEAIDRNGSASQLGIELAQTSFAKDYKLWVEDTLEKARLGAENDTNIAELVIAVSGLESLTGMDIYRVDAIRNILYLNTDVMREGYNLIKALQSSVGTGWGLFGQQDKALGSEGVGSWDASMLASLNEVQNLIGDWAMGIVDSMDELASASDSFKDNFDNITGSMYYETTRLAQAYAEVNSLVGSGSIENFLVSTIDSIASLKEFFTDETFALLMSNDINDIQAQIQALDRLSAVSGMTFEGGAREALNYLESINLVSEAMARSRENIASWNDSFLSDNELLKNQAREFGVSVPTTMSRLKATFEILKGGLGGLTDDELSFLNASKKSVEERLKAEEEANKLAEQQAKDALKAQQDAINAQNKLLEEQKKRMDSFFESIVKFVDSLRGDTGAISTTDTFAKFNSSFNDMLTAIANKAENISEVSSKAMESAQTYIQSVATSATSARDLLFAKAMIATKFEGVLPTGFASGGYTGDMSTSSIAGVVHGKEYVVNAQTTRDLGLNNSVGVFNAMANELQSMRNLMVKLVADNTKQLNTQRALLSQGVA